MKDKFGRELDYLRISLTDRCNLQCGYCMPKCGVENIPHREILTLEETAQIVNIMAGLDVKKVRLTGGEPLIRKNISGFVGMLRQIKSIEEICLTTNGILLSSMAAELKAAGLDRINISLDSTDTDIYRKITGEDKLSEVLKGIHTAYDTGFALKINCVPIKGINENDLDSIAEFAKERPIDVRYIELMPIGCGKKFMGIPSSDVLNILEKRFGRAELLTGGEHSPAVYYKFGGFAGKVGFISPISHKFCESCNRLRLTADGFLKLCLQYPAGVSLKKPLREGLSDDDLANIIVREIENKPLEHSFSTENNNSDKRGMYRIGG